MYVLHYIDFNFNLLYLFPASFLCELIKTLSKLLAYYSIVLYTVVVFVVSGMQLTTTLWSVENVVASLR